MASLRELLGNVEGEKVQKSQETTQTTLTTQQKLTVEALQIFIEMVKTDSLTESETEELKSSIESIFNNVLTESYDEEDEYSEGDEYDPDYNNEIGDEDYAEEDEYSEEDEDYAEEDEYSEEDEVTPEFACTNEECEWSGSADELSYNEEDEEAEGICPVCGSAVEQLSDEEGSDEDDDSVWDEEGSDDDYSLEDEEGELEESLLNKTSAHDKKASKMYNQSAAGKKSMKLNAKKRAKYATKISRCSEAGKTFSFKAMACVKSNKRR